MVYGYELELKNLKCDFHVNPAGIENKRPGLSWEIASDQRNVHQEAYQILVASSMELLNTGEADIWSPGLVESSQSIQINYDGKALESATRYYWKVRVRDQNGIFSPHSETASFETGILEQEEWKARWLSAPDLGTGACPWFRKTFTLESIPSRAIAFVGSVGFHELYINGKKVGDAVLTPSVSDLRKRALYNTYDISPLLKKGKNAIVIWLSTGWAEFREYNPPAGFREDKKAFCIAQVYLDDKPPVLTDNTWRYSASDTWHLGKWQNSNFGGDSVNAMMVGGDGKQVDFDDSHWAFAATEDPGLPLSSDLIEPNRMVKQIPATNVKQVSPGKFHVEMDKLYTGWIEVNVRGKPATRVIIKASA